MKDLPRVKELENLVLGLVPQPPLRWRTGGRVPPGRRAQGLVCMHSLRGSSPGRVHVLSRGAEDSGDVPMLAPRLAS